MLYVRIAVYPDRSLCSHWEFTLRGLMSPLTGEECWYFPVSLFHPFTSGLLRLWDSDRLDGLGSSVRREGSCDPLNCLPSRRGTGIPNLYSCIPPGTAKRVKISTHFPNPSFSWWLLVLEQRKVTWGREVTLHSSPYCMPRDCSFPCYWLQGLETSD